MNFGRHLHGEDRSIDLTSLIDVLFILNIFFIFNASFLKPTGLELNLPAANHSSLADTSSVEISISQNNTLYYEGLALPQTELKERLMILDRQTPVILKADRQCFYGSSLEVFDMLQGLGFSGVTLAAQPRPSKP